MFAQPIYSTYTYLTQDKPKVSTAGLTLNFLNLFMKIHSTNIF